MNGVLRNRKRSLSKCLLGLVMLVGGIMIGHAQDPRMAHPFLWKSFNNPGHTGFDGRLGVDLGIQRSFWSNPLDFRSYFVGAELPIGNKRTFGLGGVGLFFQRDLEGSLMYATNSIGLAVSGRVKIMESTTLQLGIQPVIYQKSLDPNRLVLGDQLDSYYGKILGVSPELLDIYKDKITLVDFAAGLYGKTNFYVKNGAMASVEYGFSLYHIIEPSQSFVSEQGSLSSKENLINRRMSMYLSYFHPLVVGNEINTVLSPYLMYEKQGGMSNVQAGVYWEEESYGLIGAALKKDQYGGMALSAMSFTLGVNLSPEPGLAWRICYTYELPLNQGTVYKNTTHALSLHWYIQKNDNRTEDRFANSPNNKRTYRKKVDCRSGWFGLRGRKAKKAFYF